jgi:hypothetical protein
VLKGKMSAIFKRHCYHRNGNDVIFVNNFQLLEDCSIYVVQFLSSNKKPLFKKIKSKSRFCHISKIVGSHLKVDKMEWVLFWSFPHLFSIKT